MFKNIMMRITSTYVENTVKIEPTSITSQDHLHIRGEYMKGEITWQIQLGSPPHTWRIPAHQKERETDSRITSTYVENTQLWQEKTCSWQDHLHIRGEYTKRSLIIEPFLILWKSKFIQFHPIYFILFHLYLLLILNSFSLFKIF